MATKQEQSQDAPPPPDQTGEPEPPDTDEWREHAPDPGEKVELRLGEPITGALVLKREVVMDDGKTLLQLSFELANNGGRVFVWAGPKLREAFENLNVGAYCRVTYTGAKEVGQPSPMKVYSVKVRQEPASEAEMAPRGPGLAGSEQEPF